MLRRSRRPLPAIPPVPGRGGGFPLSRYGPRAPIHARAFHDSRSERVHLPDERSRETLSVRPAMALSAASFPGSSARPRRTGTDDRLLEGRIAFHTASSDRIYAGSPATAVRFPITTSSTSFCLRPLRGLGLHCAFPTYSLSF